MLNVMLDLETLGLHADAAIVSIGAVKFDPYGTELGDHDDKEYEPFYRALDLNDVVTQQKRSVDGATLKWWLNQPYEPRAVFQEENQVTLLTALAAFWEWYGAESLPTWGNGAGFDNVILRNAFENTHGACPFSYYHDRCFRTLKALFPNVEYVKPSTPHHALWDAIAQAKHVQKLFKFLPNQEK